MLALLNPSMRGHRQEKSVSVEFIGMIQQQKFSEIHPKSGPAVDIDYIRTFAQAHENGGFDRILVPHHSTGFVSGHAMPFTAH